MRIKINNDYECFMSIPNINYWYDFEGIKLFIGWLFWGIDIIFKGYDKKHRKMPYSWIRSDKHLPKTKRQVLLFIDHDLPNDNGNDFRYRTAFLGEAEDGTTAFITPGAEFMPCDQIWWRDLIAPDRAKHYE